LMVRDQLGDLLLIAGKIPQFSRVLSRELQRLQRVVEADNAHRAACVACAVEHRQDIGPAAQADIPDDEFIRFGAHSFRKVQLPHIQRLGLGRRADDGVKRLAFAPGTDAANPVGEVDEVIIRWAGHTRSKPHRKGARRAVIIGLPTAPQSSKYLT
jgi:hypothetical protein